MTLLPWQASYSMLHAPLYLQPQGLLLWGPQIEGMHRRFLPLSKQHLVEQAVMVGYVLPSPPQDAP